MMISCSSILVSILVGISISICAGIKMGILVGILVSISVGILVGTGRQAWWAEHTGNAPAAHDCIAEQSVQSHMHYAACGVQPAVCYMQHVVCYVQRVVCSCP